MVFPFQSSHPPDEIGAVLSPLYRQGKWDTEEWKQVFKVTQLGRLYFPACELQEGGTYGCPVRWSTDASVPPSLLSFSVCLMNYWATGTSVGDSLDCIWDSKVCSIKFGVKLHSWCCLYQSISLCEWCCPTELSKRLQRQKPNEMHFPRSPRASSARPHGNINLRVSSVCCAPWLPLPRCEDRTGPANMWVGCVCRCQLTITDHFCMHPQNTHAVLLISYVGLPCKRNREEKWRPLLGYL